MRCFAPTFTDGIFPSLTILRTANSERPVSFAIPLIVIIPDFVFLNRKLAVFVDGCFWHGHDCRNTRPDANAEYWNAKRERNIKHDAEITARFESRGWKVLRIWECELKRSNRKSLEEKIKRALSAV